MNYLLLEVKFMRQIWLLQMRFWELLLYAQTTRVDAIIVCWIVMKIKFNFGVQICMSSSAWEVFGHGRSRTWWFSIQPATCWHNPLVLLYSLEVFSIDSFEMMGNFPQVWNFYRILTNCQFTPDIAVRSWDLHVEMCIQCNWTFWAARFPLCRMLSHFLLWC